MRREETLACLMVRGNTKGQKQDLQVNHANKINNSLSKNGYTIEMSLSTRLIAIAKILLLKNNLLNKISISSFSTEFH